MQFAPTGAPLKMTTRDRRTGRVRPLDVPRRLTERAARRSAPTDNRFGWGQLTLRWQSAVSRKAKAKVCGEKLASPHPLPSEGRFLLFGRAVSQILLLIAIYLCDRYPRLPP